MKKTLLVLTVVLLIALGSFAGYMYLRPVSPWQMAIEAAAKSDSPRAFAYLEEALAQKKMLDIPDILTSPELKNLWSDCRLTKLYKQYQMIRDVTDFEEYIHSFHSEIEVSSAQIDFTEQIDYVFGCKERHGIFRYVPGTCNEPNKPILRAPTGNAVLVNYIATTDDTRDVYTTNIYEEDGQCVNRIGDADTLIQGKREYNLHYSLHSKEIDTIPFSLNLLGGWNNPVESFSSNIHLPARLLALPIICKRNDNPDVNCIIQTEGNTVRVQYKGLLDPNSKLQINIGKEQ